MSAKKSRTLERLAVCVAGGMSIRDAAEAIACSESHAYHLSQTIEFKEAVAKLRKEAIANAVGKLSKAAEMAVDTLVSLLAESNEPKDRLNAAKAILSTLQPMSEFGELRERFEQLEKRQTGLRVAK